jgi:ribonuclease P protein subunit RPR2
MQASWQKRIARERIQILFDLANQEFAKHPERAHRYVELARKIAMRCRVRIPRELKMKFCKNCYKYIMPGVNCKVRLLARCVVYHCRECGKDMRYPYKIKRIKVANL